MAMHTRRNFQQMVPNNELLAETETIVYEYRPFHAVLGQTQPNLLDTFLNKGQNKGKAQNYLYAPKPSQVSETAYYLEITSGDFAALFQPRNRKLESVFVSVSLVKDILDGEDKKWDEVSDNFNFDTNADAEKTWLINTKPSTAQEARLKNLKVRVRDKKGDLITEPELLKIDPQTRSAASYWHTWAKKKFSLRGKGGKPPRSTNFGLTEPLCIVPVTENKRLLLALQESVDLVNQENFKAESQGNMANGPLVLSARAPHPSSYMFLSVDPLGIFTAYIHVADWDAWMTHVGSKADRQNSIRDFIFEGNKIMDNCYQGIAEEYEKLYNAQAKGGDLANPKTLSGNQKAKILSKRFHNRFSPKGNIDIREGAVGMQVFLEAQQIVDAVNKRAGEDSQKTVMGNVSAPDIAESLDWSKEMVIFSNAEWLHLSGFAYGGFMMTGDASGWSTSQNPNNLVFGTSETNSLMTRYESAWQSFILYEYELQKMSNNVQLVSAKLDDPLKMPRIMPSDGQLLIRTNVPEVDLEYDYCDMNAARKYTRKRFPLWDEQKAQAHRNDFKQVPGGALSDENMRAVAKQYFYIAHTIEYSLIYEHTSRLLKQAGFHQQVYFYPFSRPLLHKLESDLDRKLMGHLYRSAKQDLVEDWSELALQDLKLIKPMEFPEDEPKKSNKKGKPKGGKAKANTIKKGSGKPKQKKDVNSEVLYADFEGYGDFQQLISGLDLGDLGDFDNFRDMKTITNFGDFGPSYAADSGLGDEIEMEFEGEEEDGQGGVEEKTVKKQYQGNDLYNKIVGWNLQGKNQERELGVGFEFEG